MTSHDYKSKLMYRWHNIAHTTADIWINCDKIGSPSSNPYKLAALALSLIALGISLLVIGFLIGCYSNVLCKHKNKKLIIVAGKSVNP